MRARWIAISISLVATISLVAIVYSRASAAQLASRGPSKVAFVSGNRLVAESQDVQGAMKRFRSARQQTLTELRSKQQQLEAARRKLAAAKAGAARADLEKEESQLRAELERATAQAQKDLQASQDEVQTTLRSHLKPVLDELAGSQGIDVVLNSDVAVLWASTKLDLTAAVLERLNEKPPEGSPKP